MHSHSLYDRNKSFTIDPVSRSITYPGTLTIALMQNDHNSEIFSFELPRYVEGHDMSLCTDIQIHYTNYGASSRSRNAGLYEVQDIHVKDSDDTKISFTWLVSNNATIYEGTLEFLIVFVCVEDGETVYRWNTGIFDKVKIEKGMNNEEAVLSVCPDILEQWRSELINKDYAYESAVKNGFKGTQEDWNNYLVTWAQEQSLWSEKQETLDWVSEADITAMMDGTYVSEQTGA